MNLRKNEQLGRNLKKYYEATNQHELAKNPFQEEKQMTEIAGAIITKSIGNNKRAWEDFFEETMPTSIRKAFDNTASGISLPYPSSTSGTGSLTDKLSTLVTNMNSNGFLSERQNSDFYNMTFSAGVDFLRYISYKESTTPLIKLTSMEMTTDRTFSATRDSYYSKEYNDTRNGVIAFGFDMLVNELTFAHDLSVEEIREYAWMGNFMDIIMMQIATVKSIDMAKMISQGYAVTGKTSTNDSIEKLMYGYQHILRWADGANTFSTQTKDVRGAFGHRVTPQRLSVGVKVNSGGTDVELDSTALAAWDGAKTDALLWKMLTEMKNRYSQNRMNKFIISKADYDGWVYYKQSVGNAVTSATFGVNTETREMRATVGGYDMNGDPTMMFNGVGFVIDYNAPSIRNYGIIVLGNPENIVAGRQTTQETTAFNFNPRGSKGATWEYTNTYYMNSSVDVRESFVVAGSSKRFTATTAIASTDVIRLPKPYLVADNTKNNFVEKALTSAVNGDGTSFIYTDADPSKYKIYIAPATTGAGGDAVANSTYALIKTNVAATYNAGEDISALTAGNYVAFAEHVDGNTYLMPSEIVSITVGS